ncbi:MAG: hypothetical protein IE937_01105 [Gammaproteobacteria bacterium]|nr:hypothetical protein [Gammaproteobacteria bacterium]
MATTIEPEMCIKTGRLLTEWFEYPDYSYEQLEKMACEKYGIDSKDRPRGNPLQLSPEDADLQRKINAFVAGKRRRKWRNGMSQHEVQHRMNEATKMIDPTNYKFLPDNVRERTGLEINPLWMMECLVRSGVLAPKEQVAALKELAQFTHSKAPSISHSTTTHMKPEDWLLELAKEEYKVIGEDIAMQQPMQPVERGAGKTYEKRMAKRVAETEALIEYSQNELAQLEGIIDAEWEDDD